MSTTSTTSIVEQANIDWDKMFCQKPDHLKFLNSDHSRPADTIVWFNGIQRAYPMCCLCSEICADIYHGIVIIRKE